MLQYLLIFVINKKKEKSRKKNSTFRQVFQFNQFKAIQRISDIKKMSKIRSV